MESSSRMLQLENTVARAMHSSQNFNISVQLCEGCCPVEEHVRMQGFLTGLYIDPCPPAAPNSNADDLQSLQYYKILLKLSMAGNLRDYSVTLPDGSVQTGAEVRYGHFPAAYCKHPQENVLYLGCHDNESLYDQIVLKVNHKGQADTCKQVSQLALGVIGVSQGIAFFHAADDMLRSKSLDRDSYNSGDWFNKLIWDGSSNNFGVQFRAVVCTVIPCLVGNGYRTEPVSVVGLFVIFAANKTSALVP